jgi:hypothetical protein
MQEVRVESLDGLEMSGDQMRLSANSGSLSIVFPKEVWDRILANTPAPGEPATAELEELRLLREELRAYAEDNSFATISEGTRCGGSRLEYDLLLKPGGLFAATTGYHFAPVVLPDLMEELRACLEEDEHVEQAYAIGAVAGEEALESADENLRCLSIRGRRSNDSRFEMVPELWNTLHERLGWDDVETFVDGEG